MTIEQAIQKAVERGYITPKSKFNGVQTDVVLQEVVLLDPLFWQALGNGLGWDEEPTGTPDGGFANRSWLSEWHDFIEDLAYGKTAEEYFETLK